MEKRDYYEILGVSRSASNEDIKRAYRQLAKKYHPDANPNNRKWAEEKFKEINEAYQILNDPKKKSVYDNFGHAGINANYSGGAGAYTDDFFSGFSDVFEDIFDDFFGAGTGKRSRKRYAQRGSDLRYDINISFRESVFGVQKAISLPRLEACVSCKGTGAKDGKKFKTCPLCKGNGQVRYASGFFSINRTCDRCKGKGTIIDVVCHECRGKGRIKKVRKITVKVPAGISDNSTLRIPNEGESGVGGGASGDLYLVVHVNEDEFFTRKGDDLICEVPISFVQAALGSEVEVPTIDGKVVMKVPSGTQSGKVFRLRGKGVQNINGYGVGDQLVKVIVETPKNLGEKQKALLIEFAKISGENIHPLKTSFFKKMKNFFGK